MSYIDVCREKAAQLKTKEKVNILAIESSCDETAAAVIQNGRVILSNEVFSQIPLHALYGGVVPEIASRAHVDAVDRMVDHALKEAGLTFDEIDAIGVTCGPGLVGALLTGVSCAKGLAYALEKPLIPVNHIEGHICANYLTHAELTPPFLCLVASGGHSHILMVEDYGVYRLLGCTQDDAAGEAFDKAARVLHLPYPGGPLLDKLAQKGNPHALKLPMAHAPGPYDLSFSGLKTAVSLAIKEFGDNIDEQTRADLALAFEDAVVDILKAKCTKALKDTGLNQLVIAGGVSANKHLRAAMKQMMDELKGRVFYPRIEFCTDNGAMIAYAGMQRFRSGVKADSQINVYPRWPLSSIDEMYARCKSEK